MKVIATKFKEVLLLEPDVYPDDRGHFMEVWRADLYPGLGVKLEFVQDNVSYSRRSVLRGMHFQNPNPQGKLVTCLHGGVYDVVVDVRRDSSTFGQWFGSYLSFENGRQLYVPPGFAHGFVVLTDSASFLYKCTALYAPACDRCILWNDPDIGIDWPVKNPILSAKDSRGLRLKDIPPEALPGMAI